MSDKMKEFLESIYVDPPLAVSHKQYEYLLSQVKVEDLSLEQKFELAQKANHWFHSENRRLKSQLAICLGVLGNMQGVLEVDEALERIESLERGGKDEG